MIFQADFPIQALQFLAITSRLLGFFIPFPLFRNSTIPLKYKTSFVVLMAIIMISLMPPDWAPKDLTPFSTTSGIVLLICNDMLFGICISLLAGLAIEVVNLAGQMISMNIGFTMASQFDPSSETQASAMTVLFTQAFIIVFLAFNIHHDFIRLSSISFYQIPPGAFILGQGDFDYSITAGNHLFRAAFQMALPLIAITLFINLAMGLITRFAEDFQVLMISFPLRLGLGIIVLFICVPSFIIFFRGINDTFLDHISHLLRL